jgi:hypothetical protein
MVVEGLKRSHQGFFSIAVESVVWREPMVLVFFYL